ncbi:hypothetical protein COTS27_01015 [Spirochaetota bacterium]|nr:hypothetical protein COTS27_01015 [Spirochaetota bacterium]
MNPLQKSMLKISQNYLNFNRFALTLFLCVTIMTSCTTTSSDEGAVVPPPVPSPLEVGDITVVPSGGETSPYAAAIATIEGAVIVVSGITNLADVATETLMVSIADRDDPAAYAVEPASIIIPATALNPEGTNAVKIRVENAEFVLTPVDEEPITYSVEVRLNEFVMRTPLVAEDITFAAGRHPAYEDAVVSLVSDNVVTISGIKNKEAGFNEDLTLIIKDKTDPAEYEVTGDMAILLGAELNPDGITNINTTNNEALTFTVMPAAPGSEPVKYYVHLMLGDLIQLRLLGGDAGDLATELLLSEGTSSPAMNMISLKECGVFPPPYEVLLGGTKSEVTYGLVAMSTPAVSFYEVGTHMNVSLVLSEGSTEIETFTPLTVTTAECRTTEAAAALSGAGMEDDPYIIDNDRKLDLVARLVNANTGTYKSAHYRVTRRIDLGVSQASWSETGSTSGGFSPIGTYTDQDNNIPFTGTFDCETNEIANLYINRDTTDNIGLFGYTSDATIQNCGLTDVNVTGNNNVGGLVGYNANSTISSSYVTGSVRAPGRMSSHVGGLVGYNANSTISKSYATVSVSVPGLNANNVGGLVGYNTDSTISISYAAGSVRVMGGLSERVGGLVGYDFNTMISDSYAAVVVSGTSKVGGLIGQNGGSRDSNSYAIGRVTGASALEGLVGINDLANVRNSYWDTETTGQQSKNMSVGTPQTTTQLQSATSYPGWDSAIWQFAPDDQYPRLKIVACANRQYNQSATECTGL